MNLRLLKFRLMKQEFYNLVVQTNGQKLYEFTDSTLDWIKKNNFKRKFY